MILPLMMLVAAAAPAISPGDAARLESCLALVKSQPENGVASANDWLLKGGGILARQCLGLGYSALERWSAAATTFEQAAHEAERTQDARRSDFLVQEGNAWLAGDEAAKARTAFDAVLATAALTPPLRGEVYLDRARAGVQLGDVAAARRDLDEGLKLVPLDPFAWYISSALAVREKDLVRAKADIARAVSLAPNDADVLLEAGNIAGIVGEGDAARAFYGRVISASPGSASAKAAEAALASPRQTAAQETVSK